MKREELKEEVTALIDYYYEKVAEVQDLRDLFELNWYCKDRMMNIGYKAFNETWDTGWTVSFNDKGEPTNETE